MTAPDSGPHPDAIGLAPELAILAALDGILELAVRALRALYPELDDPERPYWLSKPCLLQASDIVALAQALQDLLSDYRCVIHAGTAAEPDPNAFDPPDDADPDDELPW